MAWALTETFDVPWEAYRRLVAAVGERPSEDLLIHVAGPEGDGVRTMSVWESKAAFESFLAERVLPVASGALGEEAAGAGAKTSTALEVGHLIKGPFSPVHEGHAWMY